MTSRRDQQAAQLGDLQLIVMDVVWELGSGTVAEVHSALADRRPVAYTTVLSTMRGLEKRGFLRHSSEGKAHRFHPTISRREHERASVARLVDTIFNGRPERLVSHLFGGAPIDDAQLDRIRDLLELDDDGAFDAKEASR